MVVIMISTATILHHIYGDFKKLQLQNNKESESNINPSTNNNNQNSSDKYNFSIISSESVNAQRKENLYTDNMSPSHEQKNKNPGSNLMKFCVRAFESRRFPK